MRPLRNVYLDMEALAEDPPQKYSAWFCAPVCRKYFPPQLAECGDTIAREIGQKMSSLLGPTLGFTAPFCLTFYLHVLCSISSRVVVSLRIEIIC